MDPVAEAPLGRGGVRPVRPLDGRGEVVDGARHGLADLALVDPLRELDVGGGVADLEADGQAQLLGLRHLAEGHHLLRSRHVHADRLLEVDVLAGGDGGLAVHRVEVGRRRDVDRVHVLAREERLVGLRALEEVGGVDGGLAELRGDRVQLLLARVQVVREHVPDRREHGARVLEEGAHHVAAPSPAAEEAEPDRRVRLGAEHQARLQDRDAGGDGRRAQELAAVGCSRLRIGHRIISSCRARSGHGTRIRATGARRTRGRRGCRPRGGCRPRARCTGSR